MEGERYSPEVLAVIERWRRHMTSQELSQKAGARKLGCSPSVLSQMLSGKYTGRPDRVAEEMVRVMRRARKRAGRPKRPPYQDTVTSQRIIDAISDAHAEGAVAVILGRTGVGKTMAARHYCENEKGAIYIVGGPKAAPGAVVKKLAADLDVELTGATWVVWQRVAAALKDTQRIIILDEVDYVEESTMQILRLIRDESGIGLAILGTPAYLLKLHSRRSATIDQWLGRVTYREILDGATREDIEQIASELPLDDEAVNELVECCEGETRRAVHILLGMQRNGYGYKAQHVRMAARELMPSMATLGNRER